MNGEGRRPMAWHFPCDNERTIAFRTNALRAYEGKFSEQGPWSRVGTIQLNWVSSAYCPNVPYFSEAGKHCAAVVGVGHQLNAMGDSTAAGGGRAQRAGGVHPASWGSQRGGGPAGGRLKIMLT